jgi:hypothetical protein
VRGRSFGRRRLAGVRLVTVKGVLITTDKYGRFHVACADIPDSDIGSNFVLKLDTRTLPTGFKMTTDNPRIVRLTGGKMSKLNFGASITRLVRFDMTDEAFAAGSVELKAQWLLAVDKLIAGDERAKKELIDLAYERLMIVARKLRRTVRLALWGGEEEGLRRVRRRRRPPRRRREKAWSSLYGCHGARGSPRAKFEFRDLVLGLRQ